MRNLAVFLLLAFLQLCVGAEIGASAVHAGEEIIITGGGDSLNLTGLWSGMGSKRAFAIQNSEIILLPSMNHTRRFHASVFYNNFVYVTGGGSGVVERLNLATNLWETTGINAPNRFGAASALVHNTWYLFGGVSSTGTVSNELATINLDTLQLTTSTGTPSARYLASFTFYPTDNTLILLGGLNAGNAPTNELYYYSISGGTWSLRSSIAPSAIGAAAIIAEGSSSLTVIPLNEGTSIATWDILSEGWTGLTRSPGKGGPTRRVGFAWVTFPPSRLAVFGGVDGETVFGDGWYFSTLTGDWYSQSCIAGYTFENGLCESTNQESKTCESYAGIQRSYVNGLLGSFNNPNTKGILRHCPSCWRLRS